MKAKQIAKVLMTASMILGMVVPVYAESGEAKTIQLLTCWDVDVPNSTQVLYEATKQYNATNPETPINLEIEVVAQDSMNQKLSVLAASNDLPDVFATGTQEYIDTYVKQGWLKSIDEIIADYGVEDALTEEKRQALLDLTKQENLYVLPMDQSIEGIWYNKQIFEDLGLEVPATIDEFMNVCAALQENGIQPMTCPGKEKWPITRLIGAYATMAGGVEAVVNANSGDLSWSDEVFLQAYSWLAEMGEKGYFGEGVTTVDTNTANAMFLNGQAAMYYNGSWFTANLKSEENTLGENVGLFAFPTVEGGKGEANTFTTSYGMFWVIKNEIYDDAVGKWVAYLLQNYGDVAMDIQGRLTAYTLREEHDVEFFTNLVLEAQATQTGSGVWPEYAMPTSVQDVEYANAQMLILNQITPEAYGTAVDDAMAWVD